MNAVIAACENEASFGIENRGKTKHRKRGRGCGRKHSGGVIAGGDGSASGIDERLLKLRVCGTRQDGSTAKKRQIRAAIELGGHTETDHERCANGRAG
jgi:hypothetical protein